MSQTPASNGRRRILYSLLGVLCGFISYLSLAVSTTALVYPLLLCFLFVKAGWLPVILSAASFGVAFSAMMGVPGMLLAGLVLLFPALITIAVADHSAPYFTQLKASVFSFAGSAAALLLILGVATKGTLVDAVVQFMDSTMRAMPAAIQDAVLTSYFPDLAENGAKSIPILGNAIRAEYWVVFFAEMRELLIDNLLPTMLKSALTTSFLCSYFTARSLRLQNRIHETAFVPISRWALPGQVTVGILLTTLAAYLYDSFAGTGGVGVFMTMFTIMECVFGVQGIAAWDRMMCAAKASFRRKMIMGGLVAIFAPTFISAIGLCSALFGRHGLLIKMKNKDSHQ